MRGTFLALLAALVLGCSATVSSSPTKDHEAGPPGSAELAFVLRVTDGDTILVSLEATNLDARVRYVGIDAPEVGIEPLADESTDANEALVDGRRVALERDVSNKDQFGRLLRHVWVETNGVWLNVSAEIVRLGLADARSYPPDTEWDGLYAAAEQEAQTAGLGIWSGH